MESYVAYSEIELSPAEVFKEIGYGESLPNNEVRAVISRLLSLLKREVRPRYAYLLSERRCYGYRRCCGSSAVAPSRDISLFLDTIILIFSSVPG